jgi:hypothetical protein
MKRSIQNKYVLCAAAVAFGVSMSVVSRAQTTNLAGTWEFQPSMSQGKPEPVSLAGGESPEVTAEGRVGRGGGGGGGAFGAQAAGGRQARAVDEFRMVIKQTPEEISILDGGVPLAYKLDGSENSISAIGRAGYPKGKAAWEGGKLVCTTRQDVYVGHAQFETRMIKYVYTLAGDTLTVDKTDTFAGKTTTTKLVYKKGA